MKDREILEITDCYNLDLHQQFTLENFKNAVDDHKDISEVKALLVESMRQLMAKDNVIKLLFKKLI